MKKNAKLLSTAEEIAGLAAVLQGSDLIAFDTEFIRESTFYPIVEIIQVANERESWLVDAAAFKKGYKSGPKGSFDPALQPLLDVFQDRSILKIVHAAQGDEECLYTSFGMVAAPIFDTAVGASLCGYGEAIGLGKLLKVILDVTIAKGHARTNWSVRPLPQQLMDYAHADVEFLVPVARSLLEKLEKLGRRDWALELSSKFEDPALYDVDGDSLAQRLARGGRLDRRGFSVLRELVQWREERVRQLNLPRRWVADDTVLVDLAHVKPRDVHHLGSFRGLNKGELKGSGEAILRAIQRGLERADSVTVPSHPRIEAPSVEESQALDLLKCYLGILADRHRISSRHLLATPQLLSLLRESVNTPEDLVRLEILSAESARLIGAELIEFVHGGRALFIRDSRIQVADLGGAETGIVSPARPAPPGSEGPNGSESKS